MSRAPMSTRPRAGAEPRATGTEPARSGSGGDVVTHVFGRVPSHRHRVSRWQVALVGLVVIAVASAWVVLKGPVVVVKSVAVQGVSPSEAAQVRAAARIRPGQPLARLDLAAVQARVERIRTVATAHVVRSWPSTVRISVTMRRPVAVVTDSHGVLHLADRTGTSYAEVTSAPHDLPQVSAEASSASAVQAVVHVLGALPSSLRAQVTSAGAATPDSVHLHLGPVLVVWGSADASALKAEDLQTLRKVAPQARRFDVSAPQAPAVS